MGRAYKVDDISYPSVTTVIGVLDKSAALMPWAANMVVEYIKANAKIDGAVPGFIVDSSLLDDARKNYRKMSQEACDIGSEIHDIIEHYIKEGRDAVGELRPEVENGFLAFLEWEKQNGVEWHESEMTVIDQGYGFAGTLDAVATFHEGPYAGRTFVIDFKSSKGFYDGYGKQIAAYRWAYSMKPGSLEVNGQGVLRLDKLTGQPEFRDYSDSYQKKLNSFLALLKFYYLDKKRRLKNNPKVKENWK